MLIGIVSDTHSRYATVANATELLRGRSVRTVIHCGDITDAATVQLFSGFDAHFVFGNCDFDRDALANAMQSIGAHSHGYWGQLERGGIKIGWTHGDDSRLLHELEASGHFDFVFHGHTHIAAERQTGKTRVINPGALQRARVKTLAILDASSAAVESIVVE